MKRISLDLIEDYEDYQEDYDWADNLDEHCMVCGAALPPNPKPGSVQEKGYCCIRCMKWDENENGFEDKFER